MLALNYPHLQAAAVVLQAADGLLITAGAGMGVDSGLPDFRGDTGFWKAYPALGDSGLHFQDIANPQAFERDPRQAWGFYGHRLQLYRNTKPHAGFGILKRWASQKTHGSFVFTSNVDGQFQSAGFSSQQVYECHGSIHQLQCCTPCQHITWSADDLSTLIDAPACRWLADLPQCPYCQQLSRPHILMFGDWQWVDAARKHNDTALENFLSQSRQMVVIELGAGTEVSTVRHFSERIAQTYQVPLIRINPREPQSMLRDCIGIAMGAQEALQALDEMLLN
jgi:NAD-dependent SIR2 family protein deacetylase